MTKYINVTSHDSRQYFPLNDHQHFVCLVDPPLRIGNCSVALQEILVTLDELPLTTKSAHAVFDVFLNQVNGSLLNGRETSLLRRVVIRAGAKSLHKYYGAAGHFIPFNSSDLDKLEFFIRPVVPADLSFHSDHPIRITLIIRQDDAL